MAYQTETTFPDTTLHRLHALRTAIGRVCARFVEIRSRRAEIQALDALSDNELAEMGLRRSDIPHHVFRNVMTV